MRRNEHAIMPRREFLMKTGQGLCLLALGGLGAARCSDACCQSGHDNFTKPAKMWKKLDGGDVRCLLCPNGCRLGNGDRGACRARQNIRGTLYTLVYSRIAAAHVDPVEKKPLFHFLPGATAYSVATAGCNLSCQFCQNWQLSQARPEDLDATLITPDDLSRRARSSGSKIVAFTYNEPTVQYEYILDAAAAARRQKIRPIIISNGYIMPEAGRTLAKALDGVKIDLKAFSEKFYSSVCGGKLAPVLDNLAAVYATGTWVEIVVLVVPSLNDNPAEIRKMAAWVRKNLSADVPMHFTRFHAMYRMQNLPPTPVSTLERCRAIAKEEGIRYPYVGNVSGHRWENTFCHSCNKMLIERSGYFNVTNHVRGGACPFCGARIPGVWA